MRNKFAIAIHGGAGTILRSEMNPEKEKAYRSDLQTAILRGGKVLEEGGSAVDAVASAVVALEDSTLFNAGKGSVFTADGKHEMDASIMDGSNLQAGATAAIVGVRNPIVLAKEIMLHSPHVFMMGDGAAAFASERGLQMEDKAYFFDQFRYDQWQSVRGTDQVQLDHSQSPLDEKKFGTVGAVALDQYGNVAAATSTGGMTNKKFGRVGDSPMIGAGNYANNNTGAISCTGDGEYFIRAVTAYDISCAMEYGGLSLQEACELVILQKMVDIKGEGGVIAVDAEGNLALVFNSEGMYRASMKSGEAPTIDIYK